MTRHHKIHPVFRPLTLALLLASSCSAWAATDIDLLTAWQCAKTYDAGFAAAQAAHTAAVEKRAQGDALLAPQIAWNSSAAQAMKDFASGNQGSSPSTQKDGQQYDAALALSKPLWDAGASANRAQLLGQADLADVQYQLAHQDLLLRTAKTYFDTLVARENLNLLQAQQKAAQSMLQLAKESFDLGLMTSSDVNDAQSKVDSLQAAELQGQSDLQTQQDLFQKITGVSAQTLVPLVESGTAFTVDSHDLGFWLQETKTKNLATRAAELGVSVVVADIDRYRLRNAPVLSLAGSLGRNWTHGSLSTSGARDSTTNATIGLVLTIPLYDGGMRSSKLRQSLAIAEQQRQNLEDTQREAERVTRLHFNGVNNGAARVRVLQSARDSSAAAVESSRLGQEAGVRTVIDVLNAQQAYFQTLLALSTARYDYLFHRIELATNAGQPDTATLLDANAFIHQP